MGSLNASSACFSDHVHSGFEAFEALCLLSIRGRHFAFGWQSEIRLLGSHWERRTAFTPACLPQLLLAHVGRAVASGESPYLVSEIATRLGGADPGGAVQGELRAFEVLLRCSFVCWKCLLLQWSRYCVVCRVQLSEGALQHAL
jgi:hypothetical protein